MSVATLRDRGYLPDALNNYLARLGHHYEHDGYMDMAALAGGFSLTHLGRAPARVDEAQLVHWQKEALARLAGPDARAWLLPALKDLVPESRLERFVEVFRHNIHFPSEAVAWAQVVFDAPPQLDEAARAQIAEAGAGFFEVALKALDTWQGDPSRFLEQLRTEGGHKGPALYRPLRLALTGSDHGPELAGLLQLIPGDLLRDRLRYCQKIAMH
jgi:glutamyl-tRNA synthetase